MNTKKKPKRKLSICMPVGPNLQREFWRELVTILPVDSLTTTFQVGSHKWPDKHDADEFGVEVSRVFADSYGSSFKHNRLGLPDHEFVMYDLEPDADEHHPKTWQYEKIHNGYSRRDLKAISRAMFQIRYELAMRSGRSRIFQYGTPMLPRTGPATGKQLKIIKSKRTRRVVRLGDVSVVNLYPPGGPATSREITSQNAHAHLSRIAQGFDVFGDYLVGDVVPMMFPRYLTDNADWFGLYFEAFHFYGVKDAIAWVNPKNRVMRDVFLSELAEAAPAILRWLGR